MQSETLHINRKYSNEFARIDEVIKRLGLFIGFFNSGVVYNSIVFRVIAGVLGQIPMETVAIVTALEYSLNAILEVPLGYLADKYGRVKSTRIGLTCISLGLLSIYIALLVESMYLKITLIFLDGLLLGFGKPLVSGSFQAFYEDAIRRIAGNDKGLLAHGEASFTKSSEFGRHLPLVGTLFALLVLFITYNSIGAVHSFAVGIIIYSYVIYRITVDLRILGEEKIIADNKIFQYIKNDFFQNKNIRYITFLRGCFQLINSVVSGYFIITALRMTEDTMYFWPMLLSITLGTALSSCIRGYILKPLYLKMGEGRYVSFFFFLHMALSILMISIVPEMDLLRLTILSFFYMIYFYIAQGALNLVTIDILNKSVDSAFRATSISIFNMPGYLMVGAYSIYLTHFQNGAPSILEIFYTTCVISLIAFLITATHRRI